MKKHVTHIKKIEYTPSDGFRFIKRSTHEFLKTRNEVTLKDINDNHIMHDDFVGERFICTDDEEVRTFLEFYERQKQGVLLPVFLKREFKDYIEIPTDEYEHDLILFSKVMSSYKDNMMYHNQSIYNNTVESRQQNIDDEIDRAFDAAQQELDNMLNRPNKSSGMYGANARYYSDINVWSMANDKVLGRGWRSDF